MSLKLVQDMERKLKEMETKVGELAERKGKIATTATFQRDEKMEKRAGDLYLLSQITGKEAESFDSFKDVIEYSKRAAIVPTDLDQWFREEFSSQLFEEMVLIGNVASMFPRYTIPANTKSLSIPQKTGRSTAYLIKPADDAIESAINDSKITFMAKRLMTLVALADEADDETVVALLALIRQDIAESIVYGMENAIINGDTDSATGINGAVAVTDQLTLWDGLRKTARTDGTSIDAGGVLDYSKFLEVRRKLGKMGINQADLVYVVSPSTYHRMLLIPEMQTVDKYGTAATVITGEVAKIGAIPIVVSQFVPEDLDATGVHDDAGDKTEIILVNKKVFGLAARSTVKFEQDRNIVNSTNLMVAHVDVDFKKLAPHNQCIATLYNVPV